jgi:hypothetical protein
MSIKASWGLTILLAATALVGCSQSRPMVRGQSPSAPPAAACPPEGMGPIIGTAPGYAQQTAPCHAKHGHDFRVFNGIYDNNFGYEGGYYAGPQGYYTDRDRTYRVAGSGGAAGCPACEYGQGCPNGGCPHCGCNAGCGAGGCPQHYQTYRFNWPQNMVYPSSEVPAGMVQYPYYINKGPSDFFMK